MKTLTLETESHIFVCCREREGKPSCGAKGAMELTRDLKCWAKDAGLGGRVKVSQSSCLGHCEDGIAVYIYPEKKGLTQIQYPGDIEDIKTLILNRNP